ncbi:MAG: hypothetical protein ABWY33_05465 [Cellulomonas sp.]
MITAVQAYDDFVLTASQTSGYLAAHQDIDSAVNETRADSSARLRDDLGLPASNCMLTRP